VGLGVGDGAGWEAVVLLGRGLGVLDFVGDGALVLGAGTGVAVGGGGVYGACPVDGAVGSTKAGAGNVSDGSPASTPSITARQVYVG
jgi:hypothetical protein